MSAPDPQAQDFDGTGELEAGGDTTEPVKRAILLRETSRTEAFSDGVFAIAITLLALNIAQPVAEKYHDPVALRTALLDQWPTYIAFLVSFINILIMWASHHNVFNVIERVDHYFLLINGMVLMAATLTPFSTAILAAHLGTDSAGLAAGVYSIVALYGALAFNLLWWWAKRRDLIEPLVPPSAVKSVTRRFAIAPAVFTAALLLSFVNSWASVGMFLVVIAHFAVPTVRKHTLDEAEDEIIEQVEEDGPPD